MHPESSNKLTGIQILYNTTFEILSRTEFQGLSARDVKTKMWKLNKAYTDAKELFRGEFRADGKRYLEHLKSVTDIILKELPHPSLEKVIVAMLHDLLEDTEVDFETLKKTFGEQIAIAVNLLTKKSIDYYMEEWEDKEYVKTLGKEEKEAYYKEHRDALSPLKEAKYYWELFSSWNHTAISVKIADRMHNLRDMLWARSPKKIQEYIHETEKYIIPWLESFGDTYEIGIGHLKLYLANLKVYLSTLKTKDQLGDALK